MKCLLVATLVAGSNTLWGAELMTSPHRPAFYTPSTDLEIDECPALVGPLEHIEQALHCRSAAVHGASRKRIRRPPGHGSEMPTSDASDVPTDPADLFPYMTLPGWGCRAQPVFNAWIAYFSASQSNGLAALAAYGDQLSEVTAFATQFDTNGALVPAAPYVTNLVATVRATHPKTRVLMTVVNDVGADIGKDPGIVHNNIATAQARAQHVQNLLKVAQNVDGLDMDYENLRSDDGPNFTLFIQELAQALHAQGKYLSVVVEPKTRDNARPIDWRAVGAVADRVRILAYNYAYESSPPGSITPPDAIVALIQYAKSRMSLDKIEIALPLHGFDWPQGKNGKEIDNLSTILALAKQYGATIVHDPVTKSAHFSYIDAQKVPHDVWFEDPLSAFQKSELIRAMGIANIGLWQLGSGNISEMFQYLQQEKAASLPTLPGGSRSYELCIKSQKPIQP